MQPDEPSKHSQSHISEQFLKHKGKGKSMNHIKKEQKRSSVKCIAMSDTHASFYEMEKIIERKEKGDIFIHGGDFTRYGREQHFEKFIELLQKIDYKYKIVISGNHEISLDPFMNEHKKDKLLEKYPCKYSREQIIKNLKKHCIYLEHELVELKPIGIRIFGSPFTQKYSTSAFQYKKCDDEKVWHKLPEAVDILVTHSPPFGILDESRQHGSCGSKALREQSMRIKPKYHIFGHIHEGRGQRYLNGIKFMNVAKEPFRFTLFC